MWDNKIYQKRTLMTARQSNDSVLKQGSKTIAANSRGYGGQAGTSLRASVSATGHFIQTFPWTIAKSVRPTSLNLSPGGSGIATYEITVTKGSPEEAAFINGQVCVTNSGKRATVDLTIVVDLTRPPSSTVIASVSLDVSEHPVLAPGKSFCYDYSVEIPTGSIIPNGTYKVTANVTITNHAGHLGTPFGPSPVNTATLASSPTLVHDTVHVDDTNGKSFTFSSGGSQTYDKTFTCENAGTNNNTAAIRETGQQSSAGVDVICDCSAMVNETVCLLADVTITPNIETGNIGIFCLGSPVIGACNGTPVEECTFTVSQNICVQIPFTFSVDATAEPAGMVCGAPILGSCGIGIGGLETDRDNSNAGDAGEEDDVGTVL